MFARQCVRSSVLRNLTTRAQGPKVRESGVRMQSTISFLNQTQAQQLDVDLMSPQLGFSIYQLMELAGLSCASAIQSEYPDSTHKHVVVLCGPGNNGGASGVLRFACCIALDRVISRCVALVNGCGTIPMAHWIAR